MGTVPCLHCNWSARLVSDRVPYFTDISLHSIRQPVVVFAALLFAVGVCPAQVQAPAGTSAARVVQMTGQVTRVSGNSSYALNVGWYVSPGELIVTGPDSSATFQVADGSTFEVFPNSKAVFRETMGNWGDLLRMVLGRVRVEIQHLGGQPNPNKVRTPTAVISVRGTIFDVTVEDDEGTTLVLVEEGRVQVQHLLQPGSPVFLDRGEYIEIFVNQPLAARKPDRGPLYQQLIKAAKDAMYEALMHGRAGTPAGTGTTAGGTAADKGGGTPGGGTNNGGNSGGGTTGGGTAPPPPPPPAPPPH